MAKQAQNIGLIMGQQQKLSPLQIQTIKLLELPNLELQQKIYETLENNPVLDETSVENIEEQSSDIEDQPKKVSISEYSNDTPTYKLYINNRGKDEIPQRNTFSVRESFQQSLIQQLGYRKLSDKERSIAEFIIGSMDLDGYLRRNIDSLVDDIFLRLNIETTSAEIERILVENIQQFEPIGVGARSLRECLLIQIKAKKDRTIAVDRAEELLTHFFEEFSKKHYSKIVSRMGISEEELKAVIDEIIRLNPKPGGQVDDSYAEETQQITPDFILENTDGKLTVTMPKVKIPKIQVKSEYKKYIDKTKNISKGEKEAASFVKKNFDNAKWYLEAVKQRHNTLQNTIDAIVDFQKEFFLDGDETKLKPMVLKNIAEVTNLDISTISRVVNSKYIQTPFGIYPLKYFFSEALINESGEEVSTREVKKILLESIENEDKTKPLTDEHLVDVLKDKGYIIARRTVAKYREQLSIPIARMRKSL